MGSVLRSYHLPPVRVLSPIKNIRRLIWQRGGEGKFEERSLCTFDLESARFLKRFHRAAPVFSCNGRDQCLFSTAVKGGRRTTEGLH